MKTEFEYLIFKQVQQTGGSPKITSKWHCCNKRFGDVLGEIKWHSSWRQYCYFPTIQAVYSVGCLNDISQFIKQLMDERKDNG